MSDDNKPKLGTRAPLGLNKAVAVGQVSVGAAPFAAG